ncbi:MAG TPA: hypothetical protein PKK61_01135 [Defluviitaleaceae bacterium]|nr:hypothetical protein [Defluviitaleaceae bacterium]
MIYRLFVKDGRTDEFEAKGDYKSNKTAQTKSEKYTKKNKEIKIIPIPTDELGVGFKIYLGNGELYGEIVRENESFWYVRRVFKDENDEAFFLKDELENKYINGTFIMKVGLCE